MRVSKPVKWGIYAFLFIAGHSLIASIIFGFTQGYEPNTIRPWDYWIWVFAFWPDPSKHFLLGLSGVIPAIIAVLIFAMPSYRPQALYGDARWSNRSERNKAGLHEPNGVLLGKVGSSYICSDNVTHTLLTGPTRAGKGTGIVVPNCLNWAGSLVLLDIKTENHRITSGYRKAMGHETFLWAPMAKDGHSHRYNPLDAISKHPAHRVSEIQQMATMLIHVSERDPMWGESARDLFVGLTLYVLDRRATKTIGEVYRILHSEGDFQEYTAALANEPRVSAESRRLLHAYAGRNSKEAASVRNNAIAGIRLFGNPVVDAAMSSSDFSIDDLRRKRMAIYVGVLPNQLETLAPILRLFFQQVMGKLSEREPQADEPHKVLLLLDEFVSLGKIDAVVSAFTLLAGYNVRVLAVIQGLAWLDNIYGKPLREGLISCCGHQVFMTTNDETTTNYVSKALGDKTVKTSTFSRRGRFGGTDPSGRSKSYSVTGRPLMSPQEVRTLNMKQQILLTEGHLPTLATKITYYDDKAFMGRLMDPATVPELTLVYERPPGPKRPPASEGEPLKRPVEAVELVPVLPSEDPNALLASILDIARQEAATNATYEHNMREHLDVLEDELANERSSS